MLVLQRLYLITHESLGLVLLVRDILVSRFQLRVILLELCLQLETLLIPLQVIALFLKLKVLRV